MTVLPDSNTNPAEAGQPGRPAGRPGAVVPSTGATATRRKPRLLPTIAASVATFAVIFEFLAFQLSAGNDPALGSSPVIADKSARPSLINRKVIKTKVVHLPPKQPAVSSSAVPVSSGSTSSVAPVVSSAPAPVAVAPAPAPAPAPVTATS
jgi:hypothetical protein